MTLKNNRAPLLCYFKLCASFRSHWWIQLGVTIRKHLIRVKINDFFSRVTLQFEVWPWKTIGHLFHATSSFVHIPWICYERSFSEFYLSIWNQLVFNQRLHLFVQSLQPYLLFFAWRNQMCFPNILVKKQMNIWIPQNKSPGIEMLINFLC